MFDRHGWYFGKNFREEGQKLLQEREMFDVSIDRISSYQEKECIKEAKKYVFSSCSS